MKSDQLYCVLDFETFSEADLKKVGAFEYSMHPSTEVICVAWRAGTRETLLKSHVHTWSPQRPSASIQLLLSVLQNPDVKLVAHNALFEQVITRNVLGRALHTQRYLKTIPIGRWICTASLAAVHSLPRKLADVCPVLNLPILKDMTGHRLMLKWSKPRRPSKNNPSTRHTDPDELTKIISYCATDIDAETHLFLRMPPLTKTERQVWLLDQKINLRGFAVDRPLVDRVLEMSAVEAKYLNAEVKRLTGGVAPTQRDKLLEWVEERGDFLPNLQKKTVEDALAAKALKPEVLTVLAYRQAASKTSTKKYAAIEARSRHDSRIRDNLMYHGAGTGRWSGMGVQPQNFPRGTLKDSIQAAELLARGDLELVRLLYGEPMDVFSSCLRNTIVAPKGKVLDVADYNAIEARVLFWIADHKEGVRAFAEGRDLYVEQAAKTFGLKAAQIADDSFERFIGKGLILGCGFQMGGKKFAATCAAQGRPVDLDLAVAAVNSYRETHKPVVALWAKLQQAAMAAVDNVGKRYEINHTAWFVRNEFLYCELPSGRRLAYHKPRIRMELTEWGKRPTLCYWGVDSKTKKWVEQKSYGGLLTENVVQATARDILVAACLRVEAAGPWQIVLTVHDEVIAEREKGRGSNKEFCDLMAELPSWGKGIPTKVKGWEGARYKK